MLFPILGLVGFAGTVIGAILLIVMIIRSKPILIPGILFLVSVVLVGASVLMIVREDSEPADSSSGGQSGKMGADVGLFNVTLTVPADFVGEDMTQEKLDNDVDNKTYKSATLNPDGSVTYVMSKKQHRELMDGIKESINQGLNEMTNSEDYPNFDSIEPNKDYTNFKVVVKSEDIGLVESLSTLVFYTYGGMYNAFNGTPVDNICVQFVNKANGKVIQEANSKDMGETPPDNSEGKELTGAGELGDSYVEIKRAELTELDDGRTAIVITYAWTNNSDETTSAMVAIYEKAFQDGVELDSISLIGYDDFDFDTRYKDVRPGVTLDVQCAFILTSNTSTVELELSESFSLSNNIVTMNFDPKNLR